MRGEEQINKQNKQQKANQQNKHTGTKREQINKNK